jgi:hypothetical protein
MLPLRTPLVELTSTELAIKLLAVQGAGVQAGPGAEGVTIPGTIARPPDIGLGGVPSWLETRYVMKNSPGAANRANTKTASRTNTSATSLWDIT